MLLTMTIGMNSLTHQVQQHRSNVRGIQAMTIVSNHHFPRHSHDQFGFGLIGFGAQRSWSGVGLVEASAGDVIFCNPGEIHDGVPFAGQVRGWRMLYFDPPVIQHAVEDEIGREMEIVRPVEHNPTVAQNFALLFTSITQNPPDMLRQEETLIRAFACIFRSYGALLSTSKKTPSISVSKAIKRLNSDPAEPVSIAELAVLVGVSRFQLLRSFVRELGITPHAYLVQKRVCIARQLLARGEMPAQAAVAAGFSDQSHMTRTFVRYIGITPARYRAAVA